MAACAGALVLALAPEASAQDVWQRPHRAMRHIHRRDGWVDWHLLTIDLRHPGVRIVGTPESMLAPTAPGGAHRWRTTSDFARATGAQVAINANYYDIFHGAFTTCGLTMSNGRVWTSTYVDRRLECWASIGFGSRGRAAVFDSHGKTFGPAAEPWMSEVVTGSPTVLRGGEVLTYTAPRHALVPNPRTLLGLDARRETLFVMVVNGREGAGRGLTCPEAARILRDFGASDAVNLDGGGSSTLYIRDEGGMVSRPADGVERAVGNHLGIVIDEHALPEVPEAPEAPAPTPRNAPQAPSHRASIEIPGLPRHAPAGAPPARPRGPVAPPLRDQVMRAGCDAAPSVGVRPQHALALVAAAAGLWLRRRRRDAR